MAASAGTCFGNAGASGASGDGTSGNPAPTPDIVGWFGTSTNGEVAAMDAKTGICTGGAGGNDGAGTSTRVNTISFPDSALLPAFPFNWLPGGTGGNGGGTFQSDRLFF
ncbi:hypothetical protein GCM10022210_22070 [Mucilaginibacter dorajii]|uniref:Uncharacterized protein n=1 Tax=Mucilaginibacter dorajii TaxID=692994 RepID=A0ABP7PYB3_9SPHI